MSAQVVPTTWDPDGDGHAAPELSSNDQVDPAADRRDTPISDRVRALHLQKSKLRVRRPRRRRWLWLTLLLLATGSGVYAYVQTGWSVFAEPQVSAVTAARERPLDIVLDANGYIIAHSLVKVGARVPGTIVELNIEEGQRVEKDQVMARLEDVRYRAELNQAKAALASARAQFEELKLVRPEDIRRARAALEEAEAEEQHMAKEAERAERLKASISASEYGRVTSGCARAKAAAEEARQALRLVELGPREERRAAAEAEVERAQAAVDKAQFFYDGTQIVATISGTVLQRAMELGEMIHPDLLSNSLCTIADLDSLEAEIDIQERDLAEVRLGQPCLITTDAYPNREYQGKLGWLSPMYNRQRGVRRAKVEILQPDEFLAPDMNCRVKILRTAPAGDAPDVIRVPKEAILDNGEEKVAFVLEGENVARRRTVEVGKTGGPKVEIRDGIAEGEIVLLAGNQPLEDGQKIRPRREPEKKRVK